jgi:hypothetical protein
MIAFHFPTTTTRGTAFGVPINLAVERVEACARELDAAVLANAAVAPTAEDESFAERFKRVCEERSGQKQRKEQAERERNRYKQRREPTKGE